MSLGKNRIERRKRREVEEEEEEDGRVEIEWEEMKDRGESGQDAKGKCRKRCMAKRQHVCMLEQQKRQK